MAGFHYIPLNNLDANYENNQSSKAIIKMLYIFLAGASQSGQLI